jgi:hypothetical protein
MSEPLPKLRRCPRCGGRAKLGLVGTSIKYKSVACLRPGCNFALEAEKSRNVAAIEWNRLSLAKWGNAP